MNLNEISVSYNSQEFNKTKLIGSADSYRLILNSWNMNTIEMQEEMKIIFLNRANEVLGIYPVSRGGLASTVVDIRIIMSIALKTLSSGIIMIHNHPSGNLKPSKDDIEITNRVDKACRYFDMKLLDHLIINKSTYFSFADDALLIM